MNTNTQTVDERCAELAQDCIQWSRFIVRAPNAGLLALRHAVTGSLVIDAANRIITLRDTDNVFGLRSRV